MYKWNSITHWPYVTHLLGWKDDEEVTGQKKPKSEAEIWRTGLSGFGEEGIVGLLIWLYNRKWWSPAWCVICGCLNEWMDNFIHVCGCGPVGQSTLGKSVYGHAKWPGVIEVEVWILPRIDLFNFSHLESTSRTSTEWFLSGIDTPWNCLQLPRVPCDYGTHAYGSNTVFVVIASWSNYLVNISLLYSSWTDDQERIFYVRLSVSLLMLLAWWICLLL